MLSEVAEQILKDKYYIELKNDVEDFDQLCLRVAYIIAGAEKTNEERNHWTSKYYQLMNELWFLPAGRILANAGSRTKTLYNCYTHSIEDSRESIYKTLANTAEIFAHGGGVGINFSKLRERGAPVSNGSAASGPISFMYVFDKSADVIRQASRRGAMLGLLEVDHPDIKEFIKTKDEEGVLTHFNLSVGLTDEFMQAVEDDEDFYLKSRYSEAEVPVDARTLFDSIARHAWKSGDPGFIYIDRLEEDNATPHTGRLETTNPCGETPLRDEACCLASINLTKMLTKIDGDWIFDKEKFVYTVSLVTRFLDSVHDVSQAPISEIDEKIMGARRIGLGIFGWADMLAMMGIPYESETALNIARVVSAIMKQAAYDTSVWLAKEKGAYPVFDPEKSRNIWYPSEPVLPTRNAMLLSLAPTGSISLLANTNNGIEPFFALAYRKNVTAGSGETKYQITNINQYLLAYLDRLVDADTKEKVLSHLALTGEIQSLDYLPAKLRELFKTAHDISPEFRVKIQAAWQKNVDGAISSTVNLPNSATVEDIKDIIMLGWKLELKGLTIFRDKCRTTQILEVGTKSNCNCETCGI
jgi:ribonucleoside-diphosphate reductase alpha chain